MKEHSISSLESGRRSLGNCKKASGQAAGQQEPLPGSDLAWSTKTRTGPRIARSPLGSLSRAPAPLSARQTGSGAQTHAPCSEDINRPPPWETGKVPALPGRSPPRGWGGATLGGARGHSSLRDALATTTSLDSSALNAPGRWETAREEALGSDALAWAGRERSPRSRPDTERPPALMCPA